METVMARIQPTRWDLRPPKPGAHLLDNHPMIMDALLIHPVERNKAIADVLAYLRGSESDRPFLGWLANCIDPDSATPWKFVLKRRCRGAKISNDVARARTRLRRKDALAKIGKYESEYRALGRSAPRTRAKKRYATEIGRSIATVDKLIAKKDL